MLFDLTKLLGAREQLDRRFEPSAFDPQDRDYRVAEPVELHMLVEKLGKGAFAVSGRARTRLEVDCSRCLEPFLAPVDAAFDLRYVPLSQNVGEGEREVGEDDLATAYYREGMLDVVELLREQFILALPMKLLCSEECRGLCQECGTNLNLTQCGCAPQWIDPRLAPLRSLLPSDRNEES